ncbi:hypothetical protein HanIR_Chr02g0062431 [Helianthus annuus]|nr:hypothetical protein HanIR_Chr02g0062431 [Helianthus annuus]
MLTIHIGLRIWKFSLSFLKIATASCVSESLLIHIMYIMWTRLGLVRIGSVRLG